MIGYLRGFLFSAKRAMTPVRSLSGGECNRVILARLFTRPSNLLVLDEPTNDLDVETLEVLEDRLTEYDGTLIVVSHDREFLDNVITSTLVFERAGKIGSYVGGYSDWLRQGNVLTQVDRPDSVKAAARATNTAATTATTVAPAKPRKLTFKLQHELDRLPDRIETLEAEVSALLEATGAAGFYDRPFEETQPVLDQLRAAQADTSRPS